MMSDNVDGLPSENPYAAPVSIRVESEPVSSDGSEREHLRVFVGSKANYYLKNWAPLLTDTGRSSGFNWAAFFLCGLWISYRKMYLVAAIFSVVILMESFAEEVVFVGIRKAEPPAGWYFAVNLSVAVVCGMFGNRWYLSHARKVMLDVRAEGLEGNAFNKRLSARGGTSVMSSIGFLLLFMIVTVAMYTVLEIILIQA